MKKKILLLLSILLLPLALSAQEATLARLLKWLDASKGIQVEFTFTAGDFMTNGKYFGYHNKFHLDSDNLMKAWYDGADLWVYVAQSGEVNLSNPETADLVEINPLLNLSRINSKEYKITETSKGGITTLKAIPQRKGDIEWMEVQLSADAKPIKLIVKEKGVDTLIAVKVLSIRQGDFPNMQQSDFYRFTKNKLPGVSVIDLR